MREEQEHEAPNGNRHEPVTCPCCYGDGDGCALCGDAGVVEASVAHDFIQDSQ